MEGDVHDLGKNIVAAVLDASGYNVYDLGRNIANEVFLEKPFVLKKKLANISEGSSSDDEVMIQGIIDCYFEEGDGIVLIDYKTDFLLNDEEEILIKR